MVSASWSSAPLVRALLPGRPMRTLLLVLASTGLMGCLSTAVRELGSDVLVRPVFRGPHFDFGLPPVEPLSVRTADGLTLKARVYRPPGAPRGQLLFLHGRDENHSLGNEAVRRFVPKGYVVVTLDQRAHGESEGAQMTYGAREVDDARRVLESVKVWPAFVMGHSMGAAVALQLASRDPSVAGVVAASPFDDLRTIWRDVTPSVVDDALFAQTVARADEKGGFDSRLVCPRCDAPSIRVPVLLLHGLGDRLIGVEHSRRLKAALGAKAELVLFTEVGHWDLTERPEVWDAVEAWLARRP